MTQTEAITAYSARSCGSYGDRLEGQQHGIEDCEYDPVHTLAKFDLETFIGLKSARWFIVTNGQTLFMPGSLTHKVITLERYLGLSSFYVSLPNALSSLTRWKLNGAIYFKGRIWEEIARLIANQVERIAAGKRAYKFNWGFYHMGKALDEWHRNYTQRQKEQMRSLKMFEAVIDRIASLSGP